MKTIVTKDYLKLKVAENPVLTIGKALVAIYERQTNDEKSALSTTHKNDIGFSAAHARIGSIGAKEFKNNKRLPTWVLKVWEHKDRKGYPRICKYAKQLNEIANEKEQCVSTL